MGKYFENIRVAFTALFSNKLRAMLTTLGISIGIASVIILVSLGQSVQGYVTDQFTRAGSNLIFVFPVIPANSFAPGRTIPTSITERDYNLIQDSLNVPNVTAVVPLLMVVRTTTFEDNQIRGQVYATTDRFFDILHRDLASGRLFDEQDMLSRTRVAILGQTTVNNLFPEGVNPVGETIRIGDVPFKVIGTLQKLGGSSFGQDQDDVIMVPLPTAQAHLQTGRNASGQNPLSAIYLQAIDEGSSDEIVENVREILHKEHKVKPGKEDDFQVSTEKDVLNSFNAVIGVLTVFLSVIGAVSLLVGGIGVMNIMLVTVTERTREIGLRKAVGARGSDILLQFLTEATVLCFVGCIIGLTVALLFTRALYTVLTDLKPVLSPESIIMAVTVTTFIGVSFGLFPASRAAKLSPIQALRTE